MLVTQSCPTLCDPMDCSPLGSSVHGILQARILERVPNGNEEYVIRNWKCVSRSVVPFSEILWTVVCQALLVMEFSRQEYWSGQFLPSPADLSNPETEPGSPALQADSLTSEPPGKRNRLLIEIWMSKVLLEKIQT